jgi:hypothetical protein
VRKLSTNIPKNYYFFRSFENFVARDASTRAIPARIINKGHQSMTNCASENVTRASAFIF